MGQNKFGVEVTANKIILKIVQFLRFNSIWMIKSNDNQFYTWISD